MKKILLAGLITAGFFLILILLIHTAAVAEEQKLNSKTDNYKSEYNLNEQGIIEPKIAEQIIKEKVEKAIKAIAARNFNELADYVHPEKGLRFTPYTHVRIEKDIVFTKEQVSNFFDNDKKYLWGHYDGSGEQIRLTPEEYYYEFIYTADFIDAEEIGYNKVLSNGNMIENQFKVYEDPIIVEYYFPGFKAKFGGMDWKSLRLVFEKYKNDWKLSGIVHNQWTI